MYVYLQENLVGEKLLSVLGNPLIGIFVDMNSSTGETDSTKVFDALERYNIRTAIPNTLGLYRRLTSLLGLDKMEANSVDYEANYLSPSEKESRQSRDRFASANRMLITNPETLETAIFDDPHVGVMSPSANPDAIDEVGCTYCFWALVIHQRPSEETVKKRNKLANIHVDFANASEAQKAYSFEFTCSFDAESTSKMEKCKRKVDKIAGNLIDDDVYMQYYNTPSCHETLKIPSHQRYWGSKYDSLLKLKSEWDPLNVFNHCHSIGSENEHCCP